MQNLNVMRFNSEVLENKMLAEDVRHLTIKVPEEFKFTPGQYISIIVEKNGEKFRRPYSIASKPSAGKIELCIKIIPGGVVTPSINKFKRGDKLEVIGPLGHFIIDSESMEKEIIFVSTGTGVGPFRSMIHNLLEKGFKKNITLISGYRNNILYDEEFKELQNNHQNFNYKVALSSSGTRVQNILPINFNAHYYICGLVEMINSVRNSLVKKRIEMKNIFSEKYD